MIDENGTNWWMSSAFKNLCATYYLIAGLVLILLMVFAAPSFGYIPCAVLFAVSAFVWKWPRQGAAFSLPFVAVFVFSLFKLEVWRWKTDEVAAAALIAIGLMSCIPCLILLVLDRIVWKTTLLAASLVATAFAIDRIWTNRLEVRSVEMEWTADGKTPWGEATQVDATNKPPVVVYVRAGGGYCYDAIFYEPLKVRLEQSGQRKVMVQYSVFKDFGRERGYNIRNIAGFDFNDRNHEVITKSQGYGGTMLEQKSEAESVVPPSCPR